MNSEPNQNPVVTVNYVPVSIVDPLPLDQAFKRSQPLHVELGSGDGSFLAKYAGLHPELNFVGVERLLGRLRKLDKKAQRAGLTNLCLIRLEATYVMQYMVPRKTAAAIHVYFPDPWPKRKHRKNRLINTRFTELAKDALQPGGVVYLRTDDEDYFAQMTEVFGASPFFTSMETPEELCAVITDFERNFNARGVKTLRAAYRLK